jgi:hypothetical protein
MIGSPQQVAEIAGHEWLLELLGEFRRDAQLVDLVDIVGDQPVRPDVVLEDEAFAQVEPMVVADIALLEEAIEGAQLPVAALVPVVEILAEPVRLVVVQAQRLDLLV